MGGFQRGEHCVWVGNLPWHVTTEHVLKVFGPHNPEDGAVQKGWDGRSRGYALVRFSNAEDVTKAIGSVDGAILEGRALIVKLDHADQRGPQKRAQQSAPYFDTQLDDPLSDDGLYDEADFMDMIDAVSPKDEMEFSASSDSEAS